jgi:hypothetical protein
MAKANSDNRKKGTLGGLALIAFGIVGAIVGYFSDIDSFDYLRMSAAKDYAILHLVLWTLAGLGIILWYNRPPDDELSSETRDDNRDGMR